MILTVKAFKVGSVLNQLDIYNHDTRIGEYECSQDADIERKRKEVSSSEDLLLWIFKKIRTSICCPVEWQGTIQSLRVDDIEVGIIPMALWGTPSWES